jgi:hypothetical protein
LTSRGSGVITCATSALELVGKQTLISGLELGAQNRSDRKRKKNECIEDGTRNRRYRTEDIIERI